ncbi:MbcA/ParS/Xre antitoxin family protein [Dongia soli]|uniref:MbcA/ParS/Xre antitoxin family protein n=1 Tax=Dongia soli TaxID=600628 RepID=A0ABU5ED34_9PROT|nr:MbcA/ParS/Xre antitoxin family protein [Dongia soli]MDY0883734.1 MbcA/ParS/Xre antitoxin family protein [Dongia soli]
MAISNKIGLSSDEIRHGVAGALTVLKTWSITDQQILAILGARDLNELKNWVTGQVRNFPADLPHRIGLVSGIHAALRQRTRDNDHAAHWLGKPNASLEGKRPIDVMTGGNVIGLMLVRDHLRGGSSR